MNGYKLLAKDTKTYLEQHPELPPEERADLTRKIKALDLLANTEDETERQAVFDTGAFNEIVLGYILRAMKEVKAPEKETISILSEVRHLFDNMTAGEAVSYYRNN